MDNQTEEISYTVRYSKRARRVSLRISAHNGLEVVIPAGMRGVSAEDIVRQREDWIRKNSDRFSRKEQERESFFSNPFPERIALRAFDSNVLVHYVNNPGAKRNSSKLHATSSDEDFDKELTLTGNFGGVLDTALTQNDPTASQTATPLQAVLLQRFVHAQASGEFPKLVFSLAEAHNLPKPTKVRIGAPRSRWGSCSGRGTISLSRNLAFLPPALMRHVILHELAHLVHLNHSAAYYSLLQSVDPSTNMHKRALKAASHYVPAWAEL